MQMRMFASAKAELRNRTAILRRPCITRQIDHFRATRASSPESLGTHNLTRLPSSPICVHLSICVHPWLAILRSFKLDT